MHAQSPAIQTIPWTRCDSPGRVSRVGWSEPTRTALTDDLPHFARWRRRPQLTRIGRDRHRSSAERARTAGPPAPGVPGLSGGRRAAQERDPQAERQRRGGGDRGQGRKGRAQQGTNGHQQQAPVPPTQQATQAPARAQAAAPWPPSASWLPRSSRTCASTAPASGASCSLSGSSGPRPTAGAGAATSTVGRLRPPMPRPSGPVE